MKAKALALCDLPNDVATKPWHSDPGLIGFLESALRIRMQKLCCRQQAPPFFPTAVLLPTQHKFHQHIRKYGLNRYAVCGRSRFRIAAANRAGI